MFWPSPQDARREYELMLQHVSVVVGNLADVAVAVGTPDLQEAPWRLLDRGVELALVKKGAQGVLVATRDSMRTVAPQRVEVGCGLGAGDAFGGAVVHGLLSGWDPVRIPEYGNPAGAIVCRAARLRGCHADHRRARCDGRRTVGQAVNAGLLLQPPNPTAGTMLPKGAR